jgi:hypothetical protein
MMSEQTTEGWEKVHTDKQRATIRLKVPGGWIYMIIPKSVSGTLREDLPASTVFVPDTSAGD